MLGRWHGPRERTSGTASMARPLDRSGCVLKTSTTPTTLRARCRSRNSDGPGSPACWPSWGAQSRLIALDRLFEAYLRHYEAAWRAYEDVLPALTDLRAAGLSIGVLTNGQEDQQRAKLQAVGLLELFICVVASSTLPSPKPAAAAFVMACERLGRPPAEVFYVGDNLHTDALAATRAGLTGVWINRLGEETQEEPPHVVTDLRAVLGLVLTRDR